MVRPVPSRVAAAATFVLLVVAAAPAQTQSETLLQLQSGSPAGDRFVVDSSGGFVAHGQVGAGTIPASGPGTRLMWHPGRGAFRAGDVSDAQWDHASVGNYSSATGINTTASGVASTATGNSTVASGFISTAMGEGSHAIARASIAVGSATSASGDNATAMGRLTTASGVGSTATGQSTTAAGIASTAMGNRARAAHHGSFVWGSTNTVGGFLSDSIVSTAIGQFSIRAVGGIRLFTNGAMSSGVTLAAGGSTWNVVSDRERKENFAPVDGDEVLLRLRGVPVTSWNYIAEGREVRHIGPMAQDWHAAFGLNDDALTINQGDFDGVNLAAIRALDERTERKGERIRALEAENAALRSVAAEMRARLERLEALVATLPGVP